MILLNHLALQIESALNRIRSKAFQLHKKKLHYAISTRINSAIIERWMVFDENPIQRTDCEPLTAAVVNYWQLHGCLAVLMAGTNHAISHFSGTLVVHKIRVKYWPKGYSVLCTHCLSRTARDRTVDTYWVQTRHSDSLPWAHNRRSRCGSSRTDICSRCSLVSTNPLDLQTETKRAIRNTLWI